MKLVAKNLSVDRGSRKIVKDVSFDLNEGDALIVTGENGAGKSTLLRAVAGLLPIAAGSLEVDGLEAATTRDIPVREYCHYLGHKNGFKDALSVRENLEFWQGFSGELNYSINEALEFVGMLHTIDIPYNYLSTGMKRRVAISKLLINDRPIWIADEPTAGLDGPSCKMFADLCQVFCEDGGILIAATHLPLGIKGAKSLEIEALPYSEDEGDFL